MTQNAKRRGGDVMFMFVVFPAVNENFEIVIDLGALCLGFARARNAKIIQWDTSEVFEKCASFLTVSKVASFWGYWEDFCVHDNVDFVIFSLTHYAYFSSFTYLFRKKSIFVT